MWEMYSFLASKQSPPVKPVIGISACLAGEQVRYNGQAKTRPELLAHLSPNLQLLPLCPEVAIGMGVPRDPIQLIQAHDRIAAMPADESDGNFTAALEGYAEQVARHHALLSQPRQVICGYIFKSRSPSCGLGSSPVFYEGNHLRFGDGIFAHKLCRKLPWLPVFEDEDLDNAAARDYFIFRALLTRDFHLASTTQNGVANFYRHHTQLMSSASIAEQQKLAALARKASSGSSGASAFLCLFSEILDRLGHREVMTLVRDREQQPIK